jgi:gamma-glutamyltranspeptidase/glutathione hydrolase
MYKGKDDKPTEASRVGVLAAGFPGSVAGLWAAYQKLASKKKTWAELVLPAAKLARDGFPVGEGFAKTSAQAQKLLARFPESAALFLPNGAPLAVGATFRSPELAATLERIAAKGSAGFYEGKTAELLVKTMQKDKGLITLKDLKGYEAKWRTPIAFDYRGLHVISMPPPASGGVVLAMIAHELSSYDLGKLGWHSAAHLHLEMEAMRRAYLARNTGLGDPDFVKNSLDELLSDAWADKQRASIKPDHATSTRDLVSSGTTVGEDGPHTTHFSVVDAAGNAVAITTTLNGWYGCGVTVTGAGFVLNNEMDDFSTVPGAPNMFGLRQGESNAIAPGKRMLSSMAPSIVTSADGKVELVLGAAGGPTITTTVFQILSNVADFHFTIAEATNAPRFHQQDFPEGVTLEKGGFSDALVAALVAMGHAVDTRDHIADAPSIGRDESGWIGVAEPRRAGSLAAGP